MRLRNNLRLLALAIALALASEASAQVRPNARWNTIQSAHFRVVYEAGLDSLAHHAAVRAEIEHARMSATLVRAPAGKIDIIIADNTDITNGYATPFPSNRIVIFARPPVDELSLQYYEDWIDLVVTHELTHIFHMDQSGRIGRALRTAFGRLPLTWPVFPILDQPRWNLEGLATMIESQHTGAGRVDGSYHEMVVRTAVLENAFDPIDRVSGETPIWPGGSRAYIYGSLFMDYIARTYGTNAHTELIKKTAGSILPPSWRMDAIAKKAVGKTYRTLYNEWRADLERTYAAQADTLRRTGITQSETLTTTGRWALHPRVSPDNRLLAYTDENGRDVTATRILSVSGDALTLRTGERASGRTGERTRRNGFGPVSWLPAGNDYVTAQYELKNRYELYSDLYIVRAGHAKRLTYGERAETPDASPDGKRIVYVQNLKGTNRLMLRDLASSEARVLVEASPDAQWTLPRWSPDGRRIAAQRWRRGGGGAHDIAFIDVDTRRVVVPMMSRSVNTAPAWSPDGRFVVFSSDRSGIPNLYAWEVAGIGIARFSKVTNLIGGAFYPDVSPDGKWIYYSGYHADGFHIERIPFDPSSWRDAQIETPVTAFRQDTLFHAATIGPADTTVGPSKRYSAMPSVLPKYWVPLVYGDTTFGTFFGATTSGADDLGRHAYFAALAYDYDHGRIAGDFSYQWAGLGNPVMQLEAARVWDNTGPVTANRLTSYKREDRVALFASFARPRWRSGSSLLVGVEGAELNRGILGGDARFADPQDKLLGFVAGAAFGNYRVPSLAISLEDGVRANGFVRRRLDLNPGTRDASYTELSGSGAAYKSIDAFGFAHHVLAIQTTGVHRTTVVPGPVDVGGPYSFLGARGFASHARVGFTAWSASLEYRVPIAMIGRGYKLRPLFIDRIAAAGFVDAGNASCTDAQQSVYLNCAGAAGRRTDMIMSVGGEVSANVAVFSFFALWLRGGVALPVAGTDDRNVKFYLALGQSF